MFNHAPPDYDCPFCRPVAPDADPPVEILHSYPRVRVRLNPKWPPNNPGQALVTPNDHFENVYDLPVDFGNDLQLAIRETALAMKTAFGCDGISTRQHNEPAGFQDVWHFHVHVTPRYPDDQLYGSEATRGSDEDMRRYAELIRRAWPSAGDS